MRKLKTGIATIISLAFGFGCSSTAQAPDTGSVPWEPGYGSRRQGQAASKDASQSLESLLSTLGSISSSEAIARLKRLRAGALSKPEQQMSAYLLARLLQKTSSPNASSIIKLFSESATHPVLGDLARLNGASQAAAENDERTVQALLAPIAAQTENIQQRRSQTDSRGISTPVPRLTPAVRKVRSEALYRVAESYYRSNNFAAAVKTFLLTRQAFARSDYATGAARYLGDMALYNDSNADTAARYYRLYLTESPGGKHAPAIANKMRSLAKAPAVEEGKSPAYKPIRLSKQDHNLLAFAYYKHTVWKSALAEWAAAGNSHILRAPALAKLKRKSEAIKAFQSAIDANPKNPLAINVATELCRSLTRAQALAVWRHMLARKTRQQDLALWNIARRSGAQAPTYYRKLLSRYPQSNKAPDALWWLIWHHIEKGYSSKGATRQANFKKAAELCAVGLKEYPDTQTGPMYAFWCGKVYEKLKDKKRALAIYKQTAIQYPGNYYGYRASHRARHLASLSGSSGKGKKKTSSVPDRKWAIKTTRPSPDPGWRWPEPPRLFAWQTLPQAIGPLPATLAWLRQFDECASLMPGQTPDVVRGWVYMKAGQVLKGLGVVSLKLKGAPQNTPHWQLAYPLAYARFIGRESKKRHLDPLLVHGLIRQESRYDPNARSRSNAMGLMQLLKGTAYGVAKNNKIALSSTSQVFKPETNIKLGCAYLGYVLRGKGGNAMLAVASYNGGPNAVKRWLRKHRARGLSDLDFYVEKIPYRETRGYVRKVFANYWNYEVLYAKTR